MGFISATLLSLRQAYLEAGPVGPPTHCHAEKLLTYLPADLAGRGNLPATVGWLEDKEYGAAVQIFLQVWMRTLDPGCV